jgi:RNA polymerase sigma-70 factor, ECF subfamily
MKEHSPLQSVKQSAREGTPKPLSQLTDEDLIAEFQQDNEAAFTLLVGRYKDPLTNFVFRFIGDRDDCNDIVQETFVRVYRRKHAYRPVAKFSTWIFTIATNLAKTFLRRRKVRGIFSLGPIHKDEQERQFDIPDENARADQLAESSMKEERIQKALDALGVKYREVIVLREIQELSYEEIAAVTGLNLGTVKSRINRGREQLQKMLKDIWDD